MLRNMGRRIVYLLLAVQLLAGSLFTGAAAYAEDDNAALDHLEQLEAGEIGAGGPQAGELKPMPDKPVIDNLRKHIP